jgi:FixJ family two-component response regulator
MAENDHLVLVLEPDEAVRSALSSLLRHHGWRVTARAEGAALAEVLTATSPLVLICETALPDMTATAVLSLCVAAGVPVVFTSHRNETQKAVDLMRKGALDFLEKPFPQKRLLEVLEELRVRARVKQK